jgi:uncharacterized membrane protein
MINFSYTIWILLIPLIVFVVTGLTGHKFKPIVTGIVGTTGLGVVFVFYVFKG